MQNLIIFSFQTFNSTRNPLLGAWGTGKDGIKMLAKNTLTKN
jgi:hypothetical protein